MPVVQPPLSSSARQDGLPGASAPSTLPSHPTAEPPHALTSAVVQPATPPQQASSPPPERLATQQPATATLATTSLQRPTGQPAMGTVHRPALQQPATSPSSSLQQPSEDDTHLRRVVEEMQASPQAQRRRSVAVLEEMQDDTQPRHLAAGQPTLRTSPCPTDGPLEPAVIYRCTVPANGDQNRTHFQSLQIIDLASNSFSGSLHPHLFEELKAMMVTRENNEGRQALEDNLSGKFYRDTVVVTYKGTTMKFTRILTAFTVIDFSANAFTGSIPESMGELASLRGLNMSHNAFPQFLLSSAT
ncbi:hypothetical protein ACQ4PT_035161 [Festuca glaucescens]